MMTPVRCWVPGCDEWRPSDGPDGILPHILHDHPGTGASVAIRRELLRAAAAEVERDLIAATAAERSAR